VPETEKIEEPLVVGEPLAAAIPEVGGRRERRRQEVRDRIYETAIELFLDKGYEGTAMDEIADRADVARATVFNHFARKQEFLGEWGSRRRARVAEALRDGGQLEDVPLDVFLESYMRVMADLNLNHRAETQELMPLGLAAAIKASPMVDTFASRVRRAQQLGEVRDGVDPEQAGAMLSASYFATIMRWISRDPPPFDLAKTLISSAHLLLRGIWVPRDGTF
jgi:AcrR family transcriptional regulator